DGTGNEVQTLTIGGTSGGTVTPMFNGVLATTALTFTTGASPTAAQVLASLNTIPYLNGNVTVVGPAAGPFLIAFAGSLSGVNVPAIDVSTVTGGTTASVATSSDGVGNEMQSLTLGGAAGGTFLPAFNGVPSTTAVTYNPNTSPTTAQLLASLNTIPGLSGNV